MKVKELRKLIREELKSLGKLKETPQSPEYMEGYGDGYIDGYHDGKEGNEMAVYKEVE